MRSVRLMIHDYNFYTQVAELRESKLTASLGYIINYDFKNKIKLYPQMENDEQLMTAKRERLSLFQEQVSDSLSNPPKVNPNHRYI